MEKLSVIGEALRETSEALGLPVEWVWVGWFLFFMVPWAAVWWGVMNMLPGDHCHECAERSWEQDAKTARAVKRGAVWAWSKLRPSKARETTA